MSFDVAKCMVDDSTKLTNIVSEMYLKRYSTAELVKELASREGVRWMGVPKNHPFMAKYTEILDGDMLDSIGGIGPVRILVVVD
jgi:hypothetical protein